MRAIAGHLHLIAADLADGQEFDAHISRDGHTLYLGNKAGGFYYVALTVEHDDAQTLVIAKLREALAEWEARNATHT